MSATVVGVLLWAEVVHARSSRRGHGRDSPSAGERGVVIVLGFANASGRINLVNRWRARVAVRCARSAGSLDSCTIICSGGAVRGPVPEALLLADHIRTALGWNGSLEVETASRSTWDNVANTVPSIGDADWIAYASGSLHAEKARAYLRRQRPDLGDRLTPVPDHRWGEMSGVKPLFAVVGLRKLHTFRR